MYIYLVDYLAHGLHLWYKLKIFRGMCRKPISQHPRLRPQSEFSMPSGGSSLVLAQLHLSRLAPGWL